MLGAAAAGVLMQPRFGYAKASRRRGLIYLSGQPRPVVQKMRVAFPLRVESASGCWSWLRFVERGDCYGSEALRLALAFSAGGDGGGSTSGGALVIRGALYWGAAVILLLGVATGRAEARSYPVTCEGIVVQEHQRVFLTKDFKTPECVSNRDCAPP